MKVIITLKDRDKLLEELDFEDNCMIENGNLKKRNWELQGNKTLVGHDINKIDYQKKNSRGFEVINLDWNNMGMELLMDNIEDLIIE